MFSRALAPKIIVSCGTRPMRARTSSARAVAMSTPSMRMRPDSGS
jgi:hypothetical protein